MAKFQDKHLKLRYNQRAYFGDNDDCSIWHDGAMMRISCTISGVDPTQDYHLTTKQYVDDQIATLSGSHDEFIELTDTPASYAGSGNNIVAVTSGEDGLEFITVSGLASQIDHGWLSGLSDDDHTQYILVDGSRDFTGIVGYDSHPTFTDDTDIVDKKYVDDQITTLSGSMDEFTELIDTPSAYTGSGNYFVTVNAGETGLEFTSASGIAGLICHSDLDCLDSDDHLQYVPRDGSRGFTATVSGVYPTSEEHLVTKEYVDDHVALQHETGRTALALNDSSKAVTFTNAFPDTNYSVNAVMNNTTDANPSIYPLIITNRTTTGFTALFSGDIDSNNYYLEWIAVADD
jgi:hypothetical protein